MNTLYKTCLVLSTIGCLNWGLVGLFDMDLVALLFGTGSFLARAVYTLVGITGLINIGLFMAHIDYKRD